MVKQFKIYLTDGSIHYVNTNNYFSACCISETIWDGRVSKVVENNYKKTIDNQTKI